MVNIIIYLKKDQDAKELVKHLLTEHLIASATIDENNTSYVLKDGELNEVINTVITAQSKSLLLSDIIKSVEKKCGLEVPIVSIPIVGTNRIYDDSIKSKIVSI
jgi:uncharacterized protein involved in tolerance to divalent cations